MPAQIVRHGLLDLQVCVPEDYTDEQAETYANDARPTGIESKWRMRSADDPAQNGAPIRVKCQQDPGHVHIMLSC